MRKICLTGLALLCICAVLVSCNIGSIVEDLETTSQNSNVEESAYIEDSETKNEDDVDTSESVAEDIEHPIVDEKLIEIYSYDDYEKYVASAVLPRNFVSYADVSELGAFHCFRCPNEELDENSIYTYNFVDESGMKLLLYITPIQKGNSTFPQGNLTALDINSANMSTLKKQGASGSYSHEGILYKYMNTHLYSIVWRSGGLEYTLSELRHFSSFCDDKADTAVGKLLNLSSASEIMAAISAPAVSKD